MRSVLSRYRGSALTLAFLLLLIAIVYSSGDFTSQARFFPWAIGVPAAVLTAIQLITEIVRVNRTDGTGDEDEGIVDLEVDRDIPTEVVVRRGGALAGWILGYFVGILLFGFNVASPVFVALYLVLKAKARISVVILCVVLVLLLQVGVFHQVLRVTWLEPAFPGPQNFLLDLLAG